jgi:hypothetical protein
MYDYLGCTLSYERAKDVANKLTKFLEIMGIISQVLKPSKVQKQTILQICYTIALLTLLCGSEMWMLKEQDNLESQEQRLNF